MPGIERQPSSKVSWSSLAHSRSGLAREAQLGSGETDAVGVAHDPGHAAHLPAQRVVEAVHRSGARLQNRIAELADERHGRNAARLRLGIERRSLFELGFLVLQLRRFGLFGHLGRV
jgi:hypothetical protein